MSTVLECHWWRAILVAFSGRDLSKCSTAARFRPPSRFPLSPTAHALCVCADRKYQVIFCNFSALSIDLWLAAASGTWLLFALPSRFWHPPKQRPRFGLCFVCQTKRKSQVNVVYLKYCACGCQVRLHPSPLQPPPTGPASPQSAIVCKMCRRCHLRWPPTARHCRPPATLSGDRPPGCDRFTRKFV